MNKVYFGLYNLWHDFNTFMIVLLEYLDCEYSIRMQCQFFHCNNVPISRQLLYNTIRVNAMIA